MTRKKRCRKCGTVHFWEEYETYGYGKVVCSSCRNGGSNKPSYDGYEKDKEKKEKKEKYDRNEWIREKLKFSEGRRVVFFTEDGNHTEGTVDNVNKDFVTLVATRDIVCPYDTRLVDVDNDQNEDIESFLKYFLRLDSIVGFGEEFDPPYYGGAGAKSKRQHDFDVDFEDEE